MLVLWFILPSFIVDSRLFIVILFLNIIFELGRCTAFGSKSGYDGCKTANISMHSYPLKNPELLNKWLDKIC